MEKVEERLLNRLNKYDQSAMDEGWADDWGDSMSEMVQLYLRHCLEHEKRATFTDFESWIVEKYDSSFEEKDQ